MVAPDQYAEVKDLIMQIYHENKGRYGYRRITLELKNRGFFINHKTVYRLMGKLGIRCMIRPKKYKSYRGQIGKVAPNILCRDFYAEKPNMKWSTDVTEFALLGEKIYLSPIIDLFNGEVISYEISKHPTYQLINNMLNKAFDKHFDLTALVFHSDQGWHYQMREYQKKLKDKGIIQSMSRKGNCLDNSPVENFFGILKSEFYYGAKFESIEDFVKELNEYISYYNLNRIKQKLKGMSPVVYRTHFQLIA